MAMTGPSRATGAGTVDRASSSLADVVETVLDKGIVIDAQIVVGVVGIRLLQIDARMVVASVETYLRFAQAVDRLDFSQPESKGLPDIVQGVAGGALGTAGGVLGSAGNAVGAGTEGATDASRAAIEGATDAPGAATEGTTERTERQARRMPRPRRREED
jgi:hypothetical protein